MFHTIKLDIPAGVRFGDRSGLQVVPYFPLIPAKAGIQSPVRGPLHVKKKLWNLDPNFRWDERELGANVLKRGIEVVRTDYVVSPKRAILSQVEWKLQHDAAAFELENRLTCIKSF